VFGSLAGVAVITISMWVFVEQRWGTISSFVTRLWNLVFGALMIIAEFDMDCTKQMLSYLAFLTTDFGRGIFFLYVGTQVLDDEWYHIFVASVAMAVGGFHIIFALTCEGAGEPAGPGQPGEIKPPAGAGGPGENPFRPGEGTGFGGAGSAQGFGPAQGGSAGDSNPFAGNAHRTGDAV